MTEHTDLDAALRRLDVAVNALEGRVKALKARAVRGAGELFTTAKADGRNLELEAAAAEASVALARAVEEVRAVLDGEA